MRPTEVLLQLGLAEVQSAAVHIQVLVSADGILPVISSYHQLLIINLTSVPGRQLVNSPTAPIHQRNATKTLQNLPDKEDFNKIYVNLRYHI
jgi:hypothetical protein